MKLLHHEALEVRGIQTRMALHDKAQTLKVIWQRFHHEVAPQLQDEAQVYALYDDYSDDSCRVLVGSDAFSGDSWGVIEDALYLCFHAKGTMPHSLMQTWSEIEEYFASPECEEQRAFTLDFEHHIGADEALIYISLY